MADVQMPESVPCQFNAKGYSPCKKPTDNGWCSQHEKLLCASCKDKAVRSCDDQMGGLACGVALCGTCQHSLYDSNHVTRTTYDIESKEWARFHATGEESPRMLADRGLSEGLPSNLAELLKGDHLGYRHASCFVLILDHNCRGSFPAVVGGTEITVVSLDRESIFKVWQSLPPHKSKIVQFECLVNDQLGICFDLEVGRKETSLPLKLFSKADIDRLFEESSHPFRWAFGLLGAGCSPRQFGELIKQSAVAHGVELSI